ncbi:MAG: hypothetical protein DRJ35_00360 [Thermoprotei archaeon]|nr:MAG: hypothetical protein DRJ35_00360 [Thermoprotei archaeon]
MKRRLLVFLGIVLFVVSILCFLNIHESLSARNSTSSKTFCILRVEADNGVTSVRFFPVNGSKTCPSRWSVKIDLAKGYRLEEARIGVTSFHNKSFEVLLYDNATLFVKTRPTKLSVRILSNIPGAKVKVNGVVNQLPIKVKAEFGEKLRIEPLSSRNIYPLNSTIELFVEENMTLRLVYLTDVYPFSWRNLSKCIDGIYVYSNIPGVVVYIDGAETSLPKCVRKESAFVEGRFKVPYNGTHTFWLAWYEISNKDNVRVYAFFENSSIRALKGEAVYLHYVLGLSDLPYVKRFDFSIINDWTEKYNWSLKTIDGWLIIGTTEKSYTPWKTYMALAVLVLPESVNNIWLETNTIESDYLIDLAIYPLYYIGQHLCGSPVFDYPMDKFPRKIELWINMSYAAKYWVLKKAWDEEINYKYPDYCLVENETLNQMLCCGPRWSSIRPVVMAMRTADLKRFEILPKTGEKAALIVFRSFHEPYFVKIRVKGVKP